jgi:hypothetical protein
MERFMCLVGPVLVKKIQHVCGSARFGLDWQQQDIVANSITNSTKLVVVAGGDTTCFVCLFSKLVPTFAPQSFVPFITSVTNIDLLQ